MLGLQLNQPTRIKIVRSFKECFNSVPRLRLQIFYICRTLVLFTYFSRLAFAEPIAQELSNVTQTSLFHHCCSAGRSAAQTVDMSAHGSTGNQEVNGICSSITGQETTSNISTSKYAMELLSSSSPWCHLVRHLCCLSERRSHACLTGSDYVVQTGSTNCSDEHWLYTVEPTLHGVAKECCLCRLVWTESGGPSKKLQQKKTMKSACPGKGCCSMLYSDLSTFKVDQKRRSIDLTEPGPSEQYTELAQITTQSTATYLSEVEDPPLSERVEYAFTGLAALASLFQSSIRKTTQRSDVRVEATEDVAMLCQPNFVWDKEQEVCIRVLTACPTGMYLNTTINKCVKRSAEKGSCDPGYRLDESSELCVDIDECAEGLANGMRVCVGEGMRCNNTLGWYNCTCEDGFKLAEDGSCVDIDECILPRNPCRSGQQCRNIIGSYQCVRQVPCGFGYVLNPKTQQCEDVNECKADPYICGPGMICINVRGGHKCVDRQCPGKSRRDKFGNCVPCPVGFVYNTSTGTCDDVNECVDGSQCKPWERCVNKLGYFVCEQKINCEHGTRISANGTHCEDIDDCMEKLFNCDKNEICANTEGSYMCIPSPCTPTQVFNYETKMCVCEDGWKDDNGTCVDINECVENPQICPHDRTCVNHDGGYRCVKFDECPPGFHRHVPFGPCVDIDECKQGTAVCGENMYCFNTAGSYQCLCQRGYKNLNSTTCADVDECLLFGSDSACPDPRARCVNTNGSHLCACPDGFTWADYPTSKCVDVDECAQKPERCGREHRCVNLEGTFKCVCAAGFQNSENQKSCVDVDECMAHLYQPDKRQLCSGSLCVNTPGGYRCQCPDGFRIGRASRCYDIDECNEIPEVCRPKHALPFSQACINLMGGYRCVSNQCPPSYIKTRLGNGFRCELDPSDACVAGDDTCLLERPQRMDNLFIEVDQETTVPQILARVDTKHLPSGIVRVDLRQHYANHLRTRHPMKAGQAFRLQRSRTQVGTVEVLLVRQLPAPADILISLHLTSSKREVKTGHSVTKMYLFVTQSASERIRFSSGMRNAAYQHNDFWTQLRHTP